MHTAEAETEISGPDNLPPGTVKELAQETEDQVTIFVLIRLNWHGVLWLNIANVMLLFEKRWK